MPHFAFENNKVASCETFTTSPFDSSSQISKGSHSSWLPPTVLPHIPAMVALETLAYLARCQPQEGYGYRPVKRVYLLQVGAAAGGTAGSVSLLSGTSSGPLSLYLTVCYFDLSFSMLLLFFRYL